MTIYQSGVEVNIPWSLAELQYRKVDFPEKAIKISATMSADYVLAESGNLYILGKGVLTGDELIVNSEEEVMPRVFLTDVSDFQVSLWGEDILALKKNGHVYYWGYRISAEYPKKLDCPLTHHYSP